MRKLGDGIKKYPEISPGPHPLPLWFYYSRKTGIFQDLQFAVFVLQYVCKDTVSMSKCSPPLPLAAAGNSGF